MNHHDINKLNYIFQNNLDTKIERDIKLALVEAIHQLFVEVEVFLIHNSFSEFPNGFRIKLNGFHIYKVT